MIDARPDAHGYDSRYSLILRGTGLMGEGTTLKISLGEAIGCGRSRHCAWSLKRTPAFLMSENGHREALRRSIPWRATSRRHCRIAYLAPDMVEIVNQLGDGLGLEVGFPVQHLRSSGGRSDADHRSATVLECEHGGVEHSGLAGAGGSDDDNELIVACDG